MKKLMELMKEPFKKPTPLELIAQQLADAHIDLLQAEQGVDYANSIVSYNKTVIARLNQRMEEYK
jgi:hypothetical protein